MRHNPIASIMPTFAKADPSAAAAASTAPTQPVAAVTNAAPVIRSDIPVAPAARGRGGVGSSKYPFDKLEVGQSFGVNRAAKKMNSTLYSAMKRYGAVVPIVDATGSPVLNKAGKPKMTLKKVRVFVIRDVDPATDPDGAKARVWRTV